MKAVAAHNNKTRAFAEAHIQSWPILAGLFWLVVSPLSASSAALSDNSLVFGALVSAVLIGALIISTLLSSTLLSGPWASRR